MEINLWVKAKQCSNEIENFVPRLFWTLPNLIAWQIWKRMYQFLVKFIIYKNHDKTVEKITKFVHTNVHDHLAQPFNKQTKSRTTQLFVLDFVYSFQVKLCLEWKKEDLI